MARKIRITAGSIVVDAELNDTQTANATWEVLPIQADGDTWGDEIYFRIPVDADLENGQEVVELGDLRYWPPGQAFCLFFGLTPASQGDEIRPASAVTVIGKISGDTEALKRVPSGSPVTIEEV
ncbi:MAG: cyclophilin-like fold protein [Chloroflexi bacterium]|nr:cyclophilin-like fold protein [Chloroflexota bacterium]